MTQHSKNARKRLTKQQRAMSGDILGCIEDAKVYGIHSWVYAYIGVWQTAIGICETPTYYVRRLERVPRRQRMVDARGVWETLQCLPYTL